MIELGRWIASYYCAPLGEALRVMAPLTGEIHSSKVWSLTDAGTDAARQLLLGADDSDPTVALLRMLEGRPLTDSYLKKKLPESARILKTLHKRGLVSMEDLKASRDPLRATAARLRVVTANTRPEAGLKLKKGERELLAFLELHP